MKRKAPAPRYAGSSAGAYRRRASRPGRNHPARAAACPRVPARPRRNVASRARASGRSGGCWPAKSRGPAASARARRSASMCHHARPLGRASSGPSGKRNHAGACSECAKGVEIGGDHLEAVEQHDDDARGVGGRRRRSSAGRRGRASSRPRSRGQPGSLGQNLVGVSALSGCTRAARGGRSRDAAQAHGALAAGREVEVGVVGRRSPRRSIAIDWAKRRVRRTSARRRRVEPRLGGESDVELARRRQPEREVERLRDARGRPRPAQGRDDQRRTTAGRSGRRS